MTRQEYIDHGSIGISGRDLIFGTSREFSLFGFYTYSEYVGCIDACQSIAAGSLSSGDNGEIFTTSVTRGIK